MPGRDRVRVYDTTAHKQHRARLLADLPAMCPRCGRVIPAGIDPRLVHLDHLIPVRDGGLPGEGVLAHRHCNTRDGADATNGKRRTAQVERAARQTRNDRAEHEGDPGFLDGGALATPRHGLPHTEGGLSPEQTAAVLALPWVAALGAPDPSATLPRLMSGPHPAAVGSYGPEAVAILERRFSIVLRWWQRLALTRLLEHDVDGRLVWDHAVVSTARQVGKSVLVRALALVRLDHPEWFGEGVIMTSATTLNLAQLLMRPAHAWAASWEPGWHRLIGNAETSITRPDGRTWRVSAVRSSHGQTVGLFVVDEAWGITEEVVEDHAEPTLLAADNPQMLVTSTAHVRATTLVPGRRAAALEDLAEPVPGSTLILEWSARRDLPDRDCGDVAWWRAASPSWTPQRERLMRGRYAAAVARGDLSSFRTQYLNIWPGSAGTIEKRPALVDPQRFAAARGTGPVGLGSPVVAMEDDFAGGGALVLAEADGDVIRVTGELYRDRGQAWDHAGWLLERAEAPRLVFGASLAEEPDLLVMPATPEARGSAELRNAVAVFQTLMGRGSLVFDADADDMARLMLAARLAVTRTGATLSMDFERIDVVRAVLFAVAAVAGDRVPDLEVSA